MDATTAALLSALDTQRDHVVGILDGLDERALRAPVLPSGWSCLGLVQHLAVDVEWFWFAMVVGGGLAEAPLPDSDAWVVAADVSAEEVFERYAAERVAADQVIAATPLEAPPACWPVDLFGDFRLPDLRAVLLHVIVETACHAGHLDAARELLDRRQWLVVP